MLTDGEMKEAERDIRGKLASVRLVAELEIQVDGELFRSAYEVLRQHLQDNFPQGRLRVVDELPQAFPGCTVVVITALGQHKGSAGQFWNQIEDVTGELGPSELRIPFLRQQDSSHFGAAFRESLQVLGLPDFAHLEQAQRNLTPILLHGGIPAQDVSDVWDELLRALRQGRQDGHEIVTWWRENPGKLYGLNMPPKRFLRETGRFAEDLIQRMLLVLFDPQIHEEIDVHKLASTYRVPRIYVDRLRLVDPEVVRNARERQEIPNPNVVLDQYSGIGPQIRIPPLRHKISDARWHVTSVVSQPTIASRRDEIDVPIAPAPRWTCELRSGGTSLKHREFKGIGRLMAWQFTPDRTESNFCDFSGTFENDRQWILADRHSEIVGSTADGEAIESVRLEDFAFGGNWSDYSVFEIDLGSATSLRIRSQEREEVVPVVQGYERPTIVGDTLKDVRDVYGRQVFVSAPRLQFSRPAGNIDSFVVFVEMPDGLVTESALSQLPNQAGMYDLFRGKTPPSGEYRVRLLALGSDIATTVVYLPGARRESLDKVFAPDENVSGALVLGDGTRVEVMIPAHEWRTEVPVVAGDSALRLSVKIGRADFSIQESDEVPKFDSKVTQCTRAEFMALRTGVSEKVLSLRLGEPQQFELRLDGSNGVNVSRTLRARPPLGRVDFRLSQLRDDVADTLAASLDLHLQIHGAAPIRLLSIAEPPDTAIGTVNLVEADSGSTKQLELEIAEALTSTNLDVYVSNLDEPWRPVNICKLAPHPGENSYILELPEKIVPGRHEVVLKAGYGGAERIVGKTSCHLGTPSEANAYFDSLGYTGFDQVVRTVRLGQRPEQVSADDYRNGVSAVGRSLLDTSLDTRNSRYQAMREYLLTEGNHGPLLEWLSQVLSEFATRAAGEAMLLRMYPHFADTMGGVAAELADGLLATVWNASPLLGVVVDSRPGTETSQPSDVPREYWLGESADFPLVFAATIDSEGLLIESGSSNVHSHIGVLGGSFLRAALREVHANNTGEQRQTVFRLAEFDRQSRACCSGSIGHREAFPLPIDLSANPNSKRLNEPARRLARYVNNLHALAHTMCDVTQKIPVAERAASLLVGEYSRSSLMVQVAVTKAVTRLR
jgi:hypothetical protein